jgi:hypothetical protein
MPKFEHINQRACGRRVASMLPACCYGGASVLSRWGFDGVTTGLRWGFDGITVGFGVFSLFSSHLGGPLRAPHRSPDSRPSTLAASPR